MRTETRPIINIETENDRKIASQKSFKELLALKLFILSIASGGFVMTDNAYNDASIDVAGQLEQLDVNQSFLSSSRYHRLESSLDSAERTLGWSLFSFGSAYPNSASQVLSRVQYTGLPTDITARLVQLQSQIASKRNQNRVGDFTSQFQQIKDLESDVNVLIKSNQNEIDRINQQTLQSRTVRDIAATLRILMVSTFVFTTANILVSDFKSIFQPNKTKKD